MAFTVEDARDLVHLLAEHPEWRAELRPLLPGDDFLDEAEAWWVPDLLLMGGDKRATGNPETILAIEVSRTLDTDDVERATARATPLDRLGYRARPAVGGTFAPERVRELAAEHGVIVRLLDQVN